MGFGHGAVRRLCEQPADRAGADPSRRAGRGARQSAPRGGEHRGAGQAAYRGRAISRGGRRLSPVDRNSGGRPAALSADQQPGRIGRPGRPGTGVGAGEHGVLGPAALPELRRCPGGVGTNLCRVGNRSGAGKHRGARDQFGPPRHPARQGRERAAPARPGQAGGRPATGHDRAAGRRTHADRRAPPRQQRDGPGRARVARGAGAAVSRPQVARHALALGLTIGLATALGGGATAQDSRTPFPASPSGGVAPEIRAQLTPRQYTTLSSEMAGRIDRVATRVGESFQKDDVLIVFDCALQRAQVARARAVQVQADKTFTINTRLVALKSMGQLELDIAAAEVQKAKADVAAAEAVASKCSISAPFAGITVEQKAREFQYTTPGQALLDILDNRNLEVELIAPSRWLSWLKTGYGFQVRVEETDKVYPARITRLGGRVDPVSQSIKVIGVITGEAPELTAGMSGRAIILP